MIMSSSFMIIMDSHGIVILLIISLFSIISSQEQTIYYEPFSSSSSYNTWTKWCSRSDDPYDCWSWDVELMSGTECMNKFGNNGCLAIRGWTSLHRQLSLSGFENIRIEVDLYTSMTNNPNQDYCGIYYKFGIHTGNSIITARTEHANTGRHDISITLPSNVDDAPQFEFYLNEENENQSTGDECWWDNLYIYGTPILLPTPSPTTTKTPTKHPTTLSPTPSPN